jgi:2,3-dihydro-2,3-dihydroxybenzoate dehydrogenase
MDFTDKSVLISGATSGIGAAVARAFAARGARLMLSGRNESRAKAIQGEAIAAGAEAEISIGDLRDAGFCARLVEQTVERFGRLDIVVNNAGIIYCETIEGTSDEQWRETMAVNLDAVFYVSRAALKPMKASGGGIIVNVASDAGVVGATLSAAYCASKGAVVLMTKAMALDHAKEGIRVNAVCPDFVDTPMIDEEFRQQGLDPVAGRAACAVGTPMGRIAEPEEVADAVLFLASDGARFITGTSLMVDGGYTAG